MFELSERPADAISKVKFAPNSPTRLLVASWDQNVYQYELGDNTSKLVRKFKHRSAVLDVCFGENDHEAFTAGLDWRVSRLDLATGKMTTVSTHEAGVKSVVYCQQLSMLVSAAFDQTLHVHFPKNPVHEPAIVELPSKPFALCLSPTKLVVAMASRDVNIYDLKAMAMLTSAASNTQPNKVEMEPWQRRESAMKFQVRAVACMPDDAGFASSSIEGRVAVEWFGEEEEHKKYAFKHHRQTVDEVEIVYPINALVFHTTHGTTFASGGADGTVALWDSVVKKRLNKYDFTASVADIDFNSGGDLMAVGVCSGFDEGQEGEVEGINVFIRKMSDEDIKGKSSK
ncbi:mitotic checkpoint protein-like protein BUB3 [Aulographum hederae CBS 113979]|uniref:Mitotic checkpoint protein-like protein BUB3 n=1 Tax=Aulographum hederae CBS 113979 TaxID=1176131 RepID=A0A6G1GW03_9PEZI|nr:mitotic checkpoint protein-like protein BUB3 [Aulographum hederae CBS 113979]